MGYLQPSRYYNLAGSGVGLLEITFYNATVLTITRQELKIHMPKLSMSKITVYKRIKKVGDSPTPNAFYLTELKSSKSNSVCMELLFTA